MMSKAFRAFSDVENELPDKGFQMTFANGITASVMFGRGNYCEHRNDKQTPIGGADFAEIAVWNGKGDYIFADGVRQFDDEGNSILPNPDSGWKTTDEIAEIIALVTTFPSDISPLDAIKAINKLV